MSSSPSSDVMAGERIGRYTVLKRLATGGMAEIYLARQDGPKGFVKLVVLKRVLPGYAQTERFVAMFLDEGRLAARLSHPNIAQTFELAEHEGRFHLAMEYVAGEPLSRLVKRALLESKPLPLGSVLRIIMQLLEALAYAHDLKGERGEWLKVVHRDVSPTNVIVTYHGGVKLLDFGIARAASHEHQTQAGTVKGKGGYMSPEQATASPIDQRTDVYAAGLLLYLMLTGVGPFDDAGEVFSMMQAAVEGRFKKPSERNPAVDPQLEQIVLKAMATRPDGRFPSASAMLDELESFASNQRVYPGSRQLSQFMRQLFPDQAELARSYDQAPDAAVVAKLAESFVEVDSEEIVPEPTRLARRGKADESGPSMLADVPAAPSVITANARPNAPAPASARAAPRSSVPLPVRSVRSVPHDELTPLHGTPLSAHLGDSVDRTIRVPSIFDSKAPAMTPIENVRVTRPAHQGAAGFEVDEKTLAVSDPVDTSPVQSRTLSVEHESVFSATASDAPEQADEPPRRQTLTKVSMPNLGSVGDIISKNPLAFVVAGLAAVGLGVLVLWALGN